MPGGNGADDALAAAAVVVLDGSVGVDVLAVGSVMATAVDIGALVVGIVVAEVVGAAEVVVGSAAGAITNDVSGFGSVAPIAPWASASCVSPAVK